VERRRERSEEHPEEKNWRPFARLAKTTKTWAQNSQQNEGVKGGEVTAQGGGPVNGRGKMVRGTDLGKITKATISKDGVARGFYQGKGGSES